MISVLVALLSGALFYYIGYNQAKIKAVLEARREIEPTPAVTRDDPRLTNPNYQNNESEVGIASPKTPQLLDWEAQNELDRLNASYSPEPK
jgi:hypothetical protein